MTFGGTILGTTSNAYIQSAIDWNYETNTANNSTTVNCRLYYRRTNSGYTTSGTGAFTITINGTTTTKTGVKLEISTSWVEAMSATVIVPHNADGSKSVSISATGSLPPSSLTSTNCGGTVTLPTIPRASTITCSPADIESNPTITITRASSSFTHTITYRFGNLTGTIANKTTATSITSWTIPAEFYTQIPDFKEGYGILTCVTYSGNTPIGNPTTCELIARTNETKCKPTVSGTVVDINPKTTAVTNNPDILVRYCSTALCTIDVTLNKNAGFIILETINNFALETNNAHNTLEIPNVGTGTFEFYAADSRGYFNIDKKGKTLVPYVRLTNDAEIHRDDPTSGNATLTIRGNYYNGDFGTVGNTNSLTVEYQLEGDEKPATVTPTINGNEYSADISLTGLEYTKAFNCEVVVKDRLNTVTKQLTLQKGIPVFDWGEDDFNFNVPVKLNGMAITDFVVEQRTDGGWTWRKWNSGMAECWGTQNIQSGVWEGTNNLYYTTKQVLLPSGIFVAPPNMLLTVKSAGGAIVAPATTSPITLTEYKTTFIRFYGGTDDKSIELLVCAYGRWK